jgi:hypothetical protein
MMKEFCKMGGGVDCCEKETEKVGVCTGGVEGVIAMDWKESEDSKWCMEESSFSPALLITQ